MSREKARTPKKPAKSCRIPHLQQLMWSTELLEHSGATQFQIASTEHWKFFQVLSARTQGPRKFHKLLSYSRSLSVFSWLHVVVTDYSHITTVSAVKCGNSATLMNYNFCSKNEAEQGGWKGKTAHITIYKQNSHSYSQLFQNSTDFNAAMLSDVGFVTENWTFLICLSLQRTLLPLQFC